MQIISILIFIIVFQIFIPAFKFNNIDIVADILIIYLTYIGFYYGRFYSVLIGFLLGITQDLITQIDLLGSMSFTKSIIGYSLGTLALYKNVWTSKSRILFIFFVYFFHFIIFYFIKFNGTPVSLLIYIQVIMMNTILSFMIFYLVEKTFFTDGISYYNK